MSQTDIFREERGVSPCIFDRLERAIFIKWTDDGKARIFRPRYFDNLRESRFFDVDPDRIKFADSWVVCNLDTETTGFPKKWNAPVSDLDNWPRMVELSFSRTEYDLKTGKKKAEKIFDLIVEPENWEIPQKVTDEVHGISQDQAELEGLPLLYVLEKFAEIALQVDFLVAHNMDFDEKIVGSEIIRAGDEAPRIPILPKLCTMRGHQKTFGGQRISLTNLHKKYFGKAFEGAHRADNDVEALSNCLEMMLREKSINPQREISDFLKKQGDF